MRPYQIYNLIMLAGLLMMLGSGFAGAFLWLVFAFGVGLLLVGFVLNWRYEERRLGR